MLITNANLIPFTDPNSISTGQAIRIVEGRIAEMGDSVALMQRYPNDERLDAGGQYVMPGNICAHTHFYGAYARGMSIPGPAPEAFPQILEKLWWGLDKALDEQDVYYSALVCIVDAIRHGATTLVDHHASPNAISGSLDAIARAVTESGVRASLCYEVTDRDGLERAQAGIAENVRFLGRVRCGEDAGGRLSALFGLHASLTLSDETLRACREALPVDTGFHIHVAEHPIDQVDSLAKSGVRVVERLERFDVLGPRSVVVHAVHVNDDEIACLARTQTWVTHQPRSNMNNAVGLPAVEKMLDAGIKVCLGNDGFSNAMWQEWKAAYLAHKLLHSDPRRMAADRIQQIAVTNNAALASQLFNRPIGVLAPGAAADIIFVDYHPYTPMDAGNLPWHVVFGFHESMVTTTLVAGKVLMKDRKLLVLDEAELARQVREKVPQTWARYLQIVGRMAE